MSCPGPRQPRCPEQLSFPRASCDRGTSSGAEGLGQETQTRIPSHECFITCPSVPLTNASQRNPGQLRIWEADWNSPRMLGFGFPRSKTNTRDGKAFSDKSVPVCHPSPNSAQDIPESSLVPFHISAHIFLQAALTLLFPPASSRCATVAGADGVARMMPPAEVEGS